MENQSIVLLLVRLWRHINERRRRQLALLLALMLLSSFAEILSLGSLIPFLAVLSSPDDLFSRPYLQPLIGLLELSETSQLLLPLTVIFCAATLISGIIRILLLWALTRLSFATGADFSTSIYQRTLYQPYLVHCSRNSSDVINGIASKSNAVIYNVIVPILTIVSSMLMLVLILITMFSIEPFIALAGFVGFGLIYALIIHLTRNQLLRDGYRLARESTTVIKSLQEGLGGIREVLLDGSQSAYCNIYSKADLSMRRAQGNNFFISQCPRFGVESLGMLFVAILAFIFVQQSNGMNKVIPILGALALGAQRLLPLMQQAYSAWSAIRAGQASLMDTLDLLDQPLPLYALQKTNELITFDKEIKLKEIEFRYDQNTPCVINNLNLTIKKGSRVGFVGATGSGKSTLVDILMGLLPPTGGSIEIDGNKITDANSHVWQSHIAHVPQVIYLADCTVEENIAFGIPKNLIDSEKVRRVAIKAKIADVIESWPAKYETFVGERGVRLSGGQRQRIGIARALYKNADLIIFDEATSALDTATERAVMEAIDGLGEELTLLIIAHRISTLKNCDMIYELEGGHIKRAFHYDEINND